MYNAGTDVMRGDPLGHLDISPDGIVERDELVFGECVRRGVPVVMLTSGGYQRSTARVIADSILNLYNKDLIRREGAGGGPSGGASASAPASTSATAPSPSTPTPTRSGSVAAPVTGQEQQSS